MTDKDGGPAFAHPAHYATETNGTEYDHVEQTGMSKLLWLAAHAPWTISDIVSKDATAEETGDLDITDRFVWAQAMLAEHKRLLEGE
jgi:hypothetical protein